MLSQVGTCHSKKKLDGIFKKKLEAPALGTPRGHELLPTPKLSDKSLKVAIDLQQFDPQNEQI